PREPRQHDACARHYFDHRRPSGIAGSGAAAAEHAGRGFDPYAVGRPAVGDPPRALVLPDLAMPATGILAADRDVGAVAVAHGVATTGNDRREGDVATAVGVVDFHFQRAPRERRARNVQTASPVFRASWLQVLLRPAPLQG